MYKIYVAIFLLAFSLSIHAQHTPKFKLGLSIGMSHSGSLVYGDRYQEWDGAPTFHIKKTSPSRLSNYNFGIGYQLSKSFSINGTIGVAKYGFGYNADVIASPSSGSSSGNFSISGNYITSLMEVSLSGAYQFKLSEDIQFIIQPGIAWYTNQRFDRFQSLQIFQKSNNYSAILFTGIEIPISSNDYYISVGLNTKIPLRDFANMYSIESQLRPYAIGIQSTLSYKFGKR